MARESKQRLYLFCVKTFANIMHAGLVSLHGKGLKASAWTTCVVTAIVHAVLEMAHLDCVFYNSSNKNLNFAFLVATSKRIRKKSHSGLLWQ